MKPAISFGTCFLGRTLVLSNGFITLEVTLDVGPRIISLKKEGGENIFFQDVNDSVNKDVSSVYGRGKAWHIFGGHRIWLSPEELMTYYPDSNPVSYEVTESGSVVFTPPAWEVQNVQTALEIAFTNRHELSVTMHVKNLGAPRDICVWGLTVCRPGATVTVPLSTKDTGFLANRNLVMWPYSSFADDRLTLKDDEIILKSTDKATKPFKLGIYNEEASMIYRLGDTTFTKRVYAPDGATYPDYCCNLETYTSELIHEVESLSPIKRLAQGESISHTEWWMVE